MNIEVHRLNMPKQGKKSNGLEQKDILEKCFHILNASEKKSACLQLPWLRSIYYLYDFGTKLSNLEMSQCFHGHINLIDYTGKGR